MRIISKYWKILLTVLFGVAVALFWAIPYMSVLSFQEQYQLFLFDGHYFLERVAVPGGLACYVAEFITQFNYIPMLGACLLALVYVLVQCLVWGLMRRHATPDVYYPLSFIPSLLLWAHAGDENVMLGFFIAILASLCAILLYHVVSGDECFPKRKWWKIAFILISMPLMYWCFGPCVLMVPLYILLFEAFKGRSLQGLAWGVASVVYCIALILLLTKGLQYPLFNLFMGIEYYRYPVYQPIMQTAIEVVTVLLPLVAPLLPQIGKKSLAVMAQVAVLVIGGWFFIGHAYDTLKYDLIEYDFLVRTRQWDKVIGKAEKRQPSKPFDVACVNLALAMTGQLSDRMFEFYQNGAEGLEWGRGTVPFVPA